MGDASSSAVETPVVEGENAERRVVFDHLIAKDSAAGVAVIPAWRRFRLRWKTL